MAILRKAHCLGLKAGHDLELIVEEFPRTDVIPFESQHRFMATLHHDHAGHTPFIC
jgi:magnesium-transporting ATPase (P-type)